MDGSLDERFWRALEAIRAQCGVSALWREWLGNDFEHLQGAFFQSLPEQPVQSYPCPRHCGCWHEVVVDENSTEMASASGSAGCAERTGPREFPASTRRYTAVCLCEESDCDDLELPAKEIIPFKLSWPKLARALRSALGLRGMSAELGLAHTLQLGAWSADAVPAVLSIADGAAALRYVSAELAARWRRPFILLSPTAQFMDAPHREFLANAGAGFFALESIVSMTHHDPPQLRAVRTPGELFARFNPQPKEQLAEDTARQAFALIERFEATHPRKQPSVLTVFRLYCLEELSVSQLVRKCHSSKATVLRRLAAIRQVTGTEPRDLRRYSSHLERIEEGASDARARNVYRRGLVTDEAEAEED